MNWGSSALNCVLGGGADSNETITRVPNFTAQGRRDASLVVSKTGSIGQRLTWVSGSGSAKVFNFASDGINRKFTNSSNVSTFDFTSSTFGNIQITGTNRSGRVMTGGILRVRDNINNVTCDYVPTNVTWAVPACNCPSQGSWSATCTRADSSTYSTSLVINGCGIGLYTEGSSTNDVKFDRCGS